MLRRNAEAKLIELRQTLADNKARVYACEGAIEVLEALLLKPDVEEDDAVTDADHVHRH